MVIVFEGSELQEDLISKKNPEDFAVIKIGMKRRTKQKPEQISQKFNRTPTEVLVATSDLIGPRA